ncbi:tyrosine-type recombinase/integrase [Actinoplanes sp. NPDC048791]|uniref:site-specific integrase n=1 Tax=Actinoplanes sp. NPDC048791 TaxID=3154623 RepID=UPI0034114F5F
MAQGTLSKHCSCRDEHGKRLGVRCPRLRRPGGAWSAHHGRWAYQLELPHKPRGDRWQLRRGGFDDRDDALAELDHARSLLNLPGTDADQRFEIAVTLKKVKAGQPLPSRDQVARRVRAGVSATGGMTVADYLQQWHRGRKIEATTLRGYESHIRVHLIPHLGHIPIDQLHVAHLQAMFEAITDRNTEIEIARSSDDPEIRARVKGARTTSAATMHRIRATLRKALNDAIRTHRLIEFNPAAHVELPSGKRPKARVWTAAAVAAWKATGRRPSAVMVWTPAQAGEFLDYAEDHDVALYPMFGLILHRGLRRGEAVGLRDADVDLDTGIAVITQQITTDGYRPITKKVKSDAGDRNITLDTATINLLRTHYARRARWQLASGPDWPHTGLLFVQPDGNAWHPDTVSNRFEQLIAGSGLPPIRLHDLRHCAATYLKASGADMKDIQETLGHSSIALTSDTYTSVILELQTERAKADAAAALVPRAQRRAG